MCFSSLVLSRRPKIFKKTSQNPQKSPHSYRLMPGFTYYCHVVGPSPGEKPYFSKKCVPLLHETILFQEMGAPLTRNHTCSGNVCPSCTKPYFSEKCVPLLARSHTFSINVCPSYTKPYLFRKCVPLLYETIFFRYMCVPLARNHTF